MQDYLLVQDKKIISNFKSKIFPIKNIDKIPTCEPALDSKAFDTPKLTRVKTRRKTPPLKLR